jgi:hypothetical protein
VNPSVYSFLPMIIVIGIAAYVFKRQERRHHFETSLFYTFDQLQEQIRIPKRDMLDSLLIVFVGLTLLEFGGLGLWTVFTMMSEVPTISNPSTRQIIEKAIPLQQFFASTMFGGAAALLILGIRSVIANMKFQKQQMK